MIKYTCLLLPLLVSFSDGILLNTNPASWLNRAVAFYKRKFSNEMKQIPPVQINVSIEHAPAGYVDSPLWDADSAMRLLALIEQSETAIPVRRVLRRALRPNRRFMSIKQSKVFFPSLLKHHINDFYYDTDEDSEEDQLSSDKDADDDDKVIFIRNPLESRLPSRYVSVGLLRSLMEKRALEARSMPSTASTAVSSDGPSNTPSTESNGKDTSTESNGKDTSTKSNGKDTSTESNGKDTSTESDGTDTTTESVTEVLRS